MKTILCLAFTSILLHAASQNLVSNADFNLGYTNWDLNGCQPSAGGTYGYPVGAAYKFEDAYGGSSTTNIVAEISEGRCLAQKICLFRGISYKINFKASRRCEAGNLNIPATLSIRVKVSGTATAAVYTDAVYNYSNSVWNWKDESQTFFVPAVTGDNEVLLNITAYNSNTQYGVVIDNITMVPVTPITVNGPATAAANSGTNWTIDNIAAPGVVYAWSFPGGLPVTSSVAGPVNVQWFTQGVKTVKCVVSNGSCKIITLTKDIIITAPLPVNIVSFNGTSKAAVTELSWVTSNEVNIDHFIIQRSKNGTNFEDIGTVKSSGVSTGAAYSFTDMQPGAGINYYRLMEEDKNGGGTRFSGIIKVNSGIHELDVAVYPTVVNNTLNFMVENPKATKLTVQISDAAGKGISSFSENISGGITQKSLNVNTLAAGIYMLTVADNNGGFRKTIKFIKQ